MAFKMKGFSGFGDNDKRILRKSNRKLIKELREKVKSGKMSRKEFRAAKEEIKGYTDVDTAKDYLYEQRVKRSDFKKGSEARELFDRINKQKK